MFLRNTRGEKMAVIDVHIKTFLRSLGHDIDKMDYFQMEYAFFATAESMGVDPTDLDLAVWDAYRRGNKKGEKDEG
jgi:thermostable 8-oxoguanine DNA glycosylase